MHSCKFLYILLLAIPATAFAGTHNFHALTVSYQTYATATSAWQVNKKERTKTASFTEPQLKVFNEQGQAVLVESDTTHIARILNNLPDNLHGLQPVPGERPLEDELRITRDSFGKTFNTASLVKSAYTLVLYVLPRGMCEPCTQASLLMEKQASLSKNAKINFVEVTISM